MTNNTRSHDVIGSLLICFNRRHYIRLQQYNTLINMAWVCGFHSIPCHICVETLIKVQHTLLYESDYCKAGNSLSRPAGRFCIGRSSWDVVGHRPGIGYVSSKNRGIGRASCVEPMPARRRPAVSNMFDITGRPTPGRQMFWVVCHKTGTCSNTNRHEFIL